VVDQLLQMKFHLAFRRRRIGALDRRVDVAMLSNTARRRASECPAYGGVFSSATDEQPLLSELVREDVRFHISVMTAAK